MRNAVEMSATLSSVECDLNAAECGSPDHTQQNVAVHIDP